MEVLCLCLLVFCVREHRFIQVQKGFFEALCLLLNAASTLISVQIAQGFILFGLVNLQEWRLHSQSEKPVPLLDFVYMAIFFSFTYQNLFIFPNMFVLNRFFWKYGSPSTVTACLKHSLCCSVSRYNRLHFNSRKPNMSD